jgi:hypothetical protein
MAKDVERAAGRSPRAARPHLGLRPRARVPRARHDQAPVRPVHRGPVRRTDLGAVLRDHRPLHGAAAGRSGRSRPGGRGPRGDRRGGGLRPHVARPSRAGAGQVPVPDRPGPPGAKPRVRRAGIHRRGQADQGVPRRGPPAGRRPLLLLRGLGGQAGLCLPHRRARPLGVAGQVIPWNFPPAHGGVETGPGPGHGQHRGA